jgi:hypothetical protein
MSLVGQGRLWPTGEWHSRSTPSSGNARAFLIEERPRSYGDQGGLTMKITSSVQCTVVSQGFVPSLSLAI